jgi:hypothetical protein
VHLKTKLFQHFLCPARECIHHMYSMCTDSELSSVQQDTVYMYSDSEHTCVLYQ